MLLGAIRPVNLVLAGMLAGNEIGTWAAVHPVLEELTPPRSGCGPSRRSRAGLGPSCRPG